MHVGALPEAVASFKRGLQAPEREPLRNTTITCHTGASRVAASTTCDVSNTHRFVHALTVAERRARLGEVVASASIRRTAKNQRKQYQALKNSVLCSYACISTHPGIYPQVRIIYIMLNKRLGHTVVHRPMGVQLHVCRNGLENLKLREKMKNGHHPLIPLFREPI